MQAGTTKKISDSGKARAGQAGQSSSPLNVALVPVLIFAFAFALRYLYNAVFMEHRIAHFGDAYNFLRSGSCLFEAVMSSHNPLEFIAKIYHAAAPQAQLLQSMTSMKLTDRLLIDGPVYPAYLAIVEWLAGVNASNPIFDSHTVQISLCNSFIDALSCVFVYLSGRLAFNRRTAIIAALLFAIYPAAIINTQHCYSEPFTYFLLSIWTTLVLFVLLRHTKSRLAQASAWCAIGLFSGLIMLAKPAFILLPPLVAAALIPVSIYGQISAAKTSESIKHAMAGLACKYSSKAVLAFIGASLVLAPWAFFNKAASGQYSVFVNRVPSFNIFHGNQIATDAWRCYPFYGCFPGDSKLVIASLLADAQKEPLLFIGLQFKKVARLWSGVWNEYHYSLFGIPLQIQSLFHQLLLLAGVLALSFLLARATHKALSRQFSAGLVLGTIVLFHFAYIPFEAISRYAISAMPAVVLLCAFLFAESWKNLRARRALFTVLGASIPCFLIISASRLAANLLASLLPSGLLELAPYLAVLADCLAFLACFGLSARLFAALAESSARPKSFYAMLLLPGTCIFLAFTVASVYTIQSHDWKEWYCSVNSGQSVKQTIFIPENQVQSIASTKQPSASHQEGTAFVLVDLSSETLAPPLEIRLNGKILAEPLVPLAQLQPNNSDILQCLAVQGEGMGIDLRTFRNWWVLPFPAASLQKGENSVELLCSDSKAKVIVYGDFASPDKDATTDGAVFLPSLRSFSYTKGFTTFDHRDPRVFEKISLQGKTVASQRILSGQKAARVDLLDSETQDLSDSPARQYGRYRVRIMLPLGTVPGAAANKSGLSKEASAENSGLASLMSTPVVLVSAEQPQLVQGENPATFVPAKQVIDLPSSLPTGTRFSFSCQLRSLNGTRPYFVGLTFAGADEKNETHSWSSKWQPIAIPASRTFKETSFSDTVPPEILSLKHLQIHPLFSPFQPDYLFLKRKQAVKSSIEIRAARLFFLKPLKLPPIESRAWTVY